MALIVREVSTTDLDALWDLIGHASTGMTSLQIDRDQLADRVERSHFAFRRTTEKPEGAPYVFVMEDTHTQRLVGTSCIFSKTGGFEPFYAYRVVSQNHHSELLEQSREIRSLHLLKIHNGPTELGGLFLLPECRGAGGGRLLSLSRFLYIGAHLKRFAKETIAELRGYLDESNGCPFWNAIGSHFFPIDYPRADALSMIDKQFIEDLMPQYPIYLELLPSEAIEAIGQVHDQAKPAYALLLKQGFQQRDLIDIFDGGAVLHCDTKEISAVRNSKLRRVSAIEPCPTDTASEGWQQGILSAENPRFHCTYGSFRIVDDNLIVGSEVAKTLHLAIGVPVSILA